MAEQAAGKLILILGAVIALGGGGAGCCLLPDHHAHVVVPRELDKVSLPDYVIQPPDVLLIDALRVEPLPPYRISTGDVLLLSFTGETFPNQPIGGMYMVEPDGVLNLGPAYGSVRVVDLTLKETQAALEKHVEGILKPPPGKAGQFTVSVAQSRGAQQIRGEHLVRPDGSVGLGTYGKVHVAGSTLEQAKAAIEKQLALFLVKPEVTVDVFGYNSMVYYVIIDQAGAGDQVIRLPLHGNETVLDALSQVNGIPPIASKNHVWVARPVPGKRCCDTLPVNWHAVSRCGSPETNYQILPGDRVFVKADPLISLDHTIAKIISPMERVLGVTLLGATTITEVKTASKNINTGGTNP